MRKLDAYVEAGGKRLRCGYTTGTCAAAATRAAAELLLGGGLVPAVCITTPAGIDCLIDIEDAATGRGWASCSVIKDAGDDPDVTDGVALWARVSLRERPGISIEGGRGVGRVTKPGLDQPVGAAAINTVPRSMIREQVAASAREHGYSGGLAVEISIPAGAELAERTFNPRLGIEGGLSVLGTSGIVRPMSEDALIESLRLELRVLRASGEREVVLVPGNYGRDFARHALGLPEKGIVAFSNYLGSALDEAGATGFARVLLVGHLGKLVKVAGGIMNLHSRVADCRMELLAAHAARAGAARELVSAIMACATTDAACDLLAGHALLEATMASLAGAIRARLAMRCGEGVQAEAIVFSQQRGVLCATPGAEALCRLMRGEEDAP